MNPARGEVWLYERPDRKPRPVLALDNTFAPRKALLTQRITQLGAAKMAEVCRALDIAAGC